MRLYDSLVRRLYQVNMFHPAKMGLTNTRRLHEALGRPADGIPTVHIAGTNGKGSVAFKMAKSLQLGGKKTGLFVSPHVSCFRERMQVNGELISEEGVEKLLPMIFDLCESEDIPATFFEITTALAFLHFRGSGVDAMVVETGLGGRLDATNIIVPALSVVTSIGLDHTSVLGNTIAEIALEKAGIFKPGVPALVGDGCPLGLMKSTAESRGSPFHIWKDAFSSEHPPPTVSSSFPDFDEENSRLAEAGLRLLWRTNPELRVEESALREGVSQRPPCRFEIVGVDVDVGVNGQAGDHVDGDAGGGGGGGGGESSTTNSVAVAVVLDVSHNPPAIKRFFEKVTREFPERRIRVVAAFSGDKDSRVCLSTVLEHCRPNKIHLAEASTPRATPAAKLAKILEGLSDGQFDPSKRVRSGDRSVRQAVRDALEEAAVSGGSEENSEKDLVVVCGTVFMMVDVRQELGFDEPKDSQVVAEVAGKHLRAAQDNLGPKKTDG